MQNAIYKPTAVEISQLMQVVSLPGYQVLEKIILGELDMMQVDILNVDPAKEGYKDILAGKHAVAKGGATFYARVAERVAGYAARIQEANQPTVLPDPTEDVFN